ncbi:MAG: cysteine desulfurase family protein [Pseudomonadota bacterium]
MRHYLDHNATAPLRAEAKAAMIDALDRVGNASAVHAEGREARAAVEAAREAVRALVGAPVGGVVFTSGGTEAIHAGISGLANRNVGSDNAIARLFVSAVEHPAVLKTAEATGLPVEIISVDANGVVDLQQLRSRLADNDDGAPFLATIMLANNETGVVQPIRAAADIIHDAGGLLFVDAVQAAGKIPVNCTMLGADLMAVSAHKFGGPIGVGALIAAPNLPLEPVLRGGGQEENRRAGTHNVAAIAGFGAAAAATRDDIGRHTEITAIRDHIEAAVVAEGARVWGAGVERLPGTVCCSAPGFSGETQVMALDMAGVAVSAGSACSSGKARPSPVLTAMGATEDEAKSALRVSLGWSSMMADADAFIAAWTSAYARVKARAA